MKFIIYYLAYGKVQEKPAGRVVHVCVCVWSERWKSATLSKRRKKLQKSKWKWKSLKWQLSFLYEANNKLLLIFSFCWVMLFKVFCWGNKQIEKQTNKQRDRQRHRQTNICACLSLAVSLCLSMRNCLWQKKNFYISYFYISMHAKVTKEGQGAAAQFHLQLICNPVRFLISQLAFSRVRIVNNSLSLLALCKYLS